MSEQGKSKSKMNRLEQAAVLLMSLGERDAAAVLRHLGPKEVQRLGTAMTQLQNVSQSDVEAVVTSFLNEASTLTGLGVGSDNYIRKMLVEALGEDKASSLVDRILMGGNTTGLDTLKWMDPRSVADLIRHEHPQIQSIVVAYLDADQAAEVLSNLSEKQRLDIVMRVASLDSVQPSALQELNAILEKQFSGNASSQTKAMGGIKVAANIMNNLESSLEGELMESIRDLDEDLGARIQDLMFVFEDLKNIDDRGIQALLREVSSEVLILALKGADDELQEKVFKNMSKRAAELLRDDLEAKGPVRVSEVEAAQKEILTIARRMADSGEIQLGTGAEEMI
ncbi:MAG: flagellar motor switch protein FliG [Spongiibacteraceae bacterium]|nr:flagellar motor switch protein FliG [Spongiibacteraceae bacterium]